jgi:hypothetical protein
MFTVRWSQYASDELGRLWAEADAETRTLLSVVIQWIDQELRSDPLSLGESREGADRIWFIPPLAIRFEVNRAERFARVLHVWTFRRRK